MDVNIVNQNLSKAGVSNLKDKISNAKEDEKLKEACQGFEAIFMNSMIKAMRSTLPGNALFEKSNDMDIYESMHDQYLSEQLARSNQSMGLKDFLYEQLKSTIKE